MLALWLLALLLTAIAAVTDARSGRIPNWLTLSTLVIALGLQSTRGGDELTVALIGGLVCSAVPLLLYWFSRDAIGGGDIKLFAALGVLLGPTLGLEVQLAAYLVGSGFALIRVTLQGKLRQLFSSALAVVVTRVRPKAETPQVTPELLTPIRIGPAIFVSCALDACWSLGVL